MSKTLIGANLKTHMAGEVTTLAILFKLTRPDGTVYGFTNHDIDIVYPAVGGITYEASSGNFPTAMDQTANLSVDNIEALAFLESDRITEADLIGRRYDYSRIDIYLINYNVIADGIMILGKDWILGELTIKNNNFTFEVRSKAQILQQKIIELYSPDCRADLGDARCGIDLDGDPNYTFTGTVTGVTDNRTFADSSRSEANDYFNYGLLTWLTGDNAGLTMEVKDYTLSGGVFVLVEKMGFTIQIGDTYSVYAGCDKLKDTCIDKFDNIVNFRGEPFLPGIDETMRIRFS